GAAIIEVMPTRSAISAATLEEVARRSAQEVLEALRRSEERNARLQRDVESLTLQLEWFRRQIFGSTSEKRIVEVASGQLHLGEMLAVPEQSMAPAREVPAHVRRLPRSDLADSGNDESSLFFDESRVPVKVIEVPNPAVQGLSAEQYEVVGQKVSHRLAQQPGSYVVLKYVRPVIKRRDTQ